MIREAIAEYGAGDFAEARALFERAHAARPSARTLRGLGITSFELKRYVQSLKELNAALADVRAPLTESQRAEVQALVEKARRFVGKVKLDISPRSASVFVDDQPVASRELTLDLGTYRVTVRAAGYGETELKLVIDGGEDRSQRMVLKPLDVTPTRAIVLDAGRSDVAITNRTGDEGAPSVVGRWWLWASIGAAVAGGTVLALALSASGHAGQQAPYQGSAGSLRGP